MASMLLGSLGSSILGPLGGWIGSAVGSYIDNMLFSPKPEDQKGPRLDDLNVTKADPGVPIPLVFGADRIPGIVIASGPLIETVNKEKVGGKGGPTQNIITYTYHVDIDYMLCEGPILGVARIWSEGNLVRGTRYELETSTSDNPENIGGIPYPSYYRDHLYDPNKIPWSLDRNYSSTDEGGNYVSTLNRLSMVPISSPAASEMLENGFEVVYWKDTSSGYYIPIREDHAYGVSKELSGRPPEVITVLGGFAGASGIGNSQSLKKFYTFIDLGVYMDTQTLDRIVEAGGQISLKYKSRVGEDEAYGVDVSARSVNTNVKFYRDGGNNTVDGSNIGEIIGGATNYGRSLEVNDVEIVEGPLNIPAGTRFVEISSQYALMFPIFALSHSMESTGFTISYGRIFDSEGEEVRDWPDYWNLYDAINDWSDIAVLQFKGVDNLTVYHGTMDQHFDEYMRAALQAELEDKIKEGETFAIPAYIGRAHVVFEKLQLADYGNRIPSLSFEVVQYDDVRIAMVLEDMMRRATVGEEYYDLTALPSVGQRSHVLGYSIGSKTTFRAAMETIMEAFRIDCAEVGNELVFRPRDRGIDWEIDWTDLAAVEAGRDPDEIIELQYRDKVEMPRSLTVRFKDVERAYNVNTAHYYRQQGPSVQESMVELASVLPPSIAKSHARDKMRDVWLERVSVKIKAPHKYVYIYPTDIVKINGATYGKQDVVFKVTSVTRGDNGILDIDGVLREQTVYVPLEGEVTNTDMDNSTWTNRPKPINVQPVFTVMEFLDIAPLREEDVIGSPGFYGAMGGGSGWRGAGLYVSQDTGVTYKLLTTSSTRACLGFAWTKLLYHRFEFIDTVNYVDVMLSNDLDELETITTEQLYAGFNYCKLGDEIFQFMTAEKLISPRNMWRLTNLVRGRRGTDTFEILDGHRVGETFTILQAGPVFRLSQSAGLIDTEQYYKVVPFGANLTDVDPVPFTNKGNLTKPFAPVFIHGERDGSNNLSIRWLRQDKIGWGWYEGQDTTLSENTWNHVIEILPPLTGDSPVRVMNCYIPASPYDREKIVYQGVDYGYVATDFGSDFIYTAAQQTADGYTPGDPVRVRIYKNYAGGRGHPGTARI